MTKYTERLVWQVSTRFNERNTILYLMTQVISFCVHSGSVLPKPMLFGNTILIPLISLPSIYLVTPIPVLVRTDIHCDKRICITRTEVTGLTALCCVTLLGDIDGYLSGWRGTRKIGTDFNITNL